MALVQDLSRLIVEYLASDTFASGLVLDECTFSVQ